MSFAGTERRQEVRIRLALGALNGFLEVAGRPNFMPQQTLSL